MNLFFKISVNFSIYPTLKTWQDVQRPYMGIEQKVAEQRALFVAVAIVATEELTPPRRIMHLPILHPQ